ncbi:hypothetical protein HYALB_00007980 [Hymenoscyphus albidus]|uniref:Uncharacterized protein n=1 Tax=Hymenoscyphus albidus TaxID=595503 RepID=A0A9N9LCH8_9HELO|nr:hypothetical protein HYALB_00007980 [Hymenoscyphus albidus]
MQSNTSSSTNSTTHRPARAATSLRNRLNRLFSSSPSETSLEPTSSNASDRHLVLQGYLQRSGLMIAESESQILDLRYRLGVLGVEDLPPLTPFYRRWQEFVEPGIEAILQLGPEYVHLLDMQLSWVRRVLQEQNAIILHLREWRRELERERSLFSCWINSDSEIKGLVETETELLVWLNPIE